MTPAYPASVPGIFDLRLPERLAAPLVLDSPHSGTIYPPDFAPVQPASRYRRAEDAFVDDLFGAAPALGLPLLACRFARIYCDVNRGADDLSPEAVAGDPGFTLTPTAKAMLGKGVIWTATPPDGAPLYADRLAAPDVAHRIDTCWRPYHDALAGLCDAVHAEAGVLYHLDLHSMQATANPMHEDALGSVRPDIVVSDRDGTTADPAFTEAARAALAGLGFEVCLNDPYKGAEIVRVCGRPAEGRHSIQIEVNRRLYMDEETLEKTAEYAETKARLTLFLERMRDWLPHSREEC